MNQFCRNPYLNDIEENLFTELSSLISDRAVSINESVNILRGDLEEHQNWTRSELADLDSSIDNLLDGALLTLLPHMNSMKESITTDLSSLISDRIDESVSSLNEEHKNQATSLKECLNETLSQLSEDLEEQKLDNI